MVHGLLVATCSLAIMLDPLSAELGSAVKWLFAGCQKLSRSHNLAYQEVRGTWNTTLKEGVVGEKSWLLNQLGTAEGLPWPLAKHLLCAKH